MARADRAESRRTSRKPRHRQATLAATKSRYSRRGSSNLEVDGMSRYRPRLTYANVMSTLAVFGLLGGGAFAAAKIGPKDIAKNAVRSKHIKAGAVKARHLAPG